MKKDNIVNIPNDIKPQIKQWISFKKEIKELEEKIVPLEENIKFHFLGCWFQIFSKEHIRPTSLKSEDNDIMFVQTNKTTYTKDKVKDLKEVSKELNLDIDKYVELNSISFNMEKMKEFGLDTILLDFIKEKISDDKKAKVLKENYSFSDSLLENLDCLVKTSEKNKNSTITNRIKKIVEILNPVNYLQEIKKKA